jgi:predicted transcriptional regulator
VLSTLWSHDGPLTVTEVRDRVGGDLAETTIRTILNRLHRKGQAERVKTGRAFAYSAKVEQADVVSAEVRRLLALGDDRRVALQGLIDGLTPDDERELRRLLARAERQRKREAGS